MAKPAADNPNIDSFEVDVFARACPSRGALHDITGRWGALSLVALSDGPYRFNALRRRVDGVSERMLAQTLQTLERDGLVNREVLESIPPKVEYSLTDLGAAVATQLSGLIEMVESRMPEVLTARAKYDSIGASRS